MLVVTRFPHVSHQISVTCKSLHEPKSVVLLLLASHALGELNTWKLHEFAGVVLTLASTALFSYHRHNVAMLASVEQKREREQQDQGLEGASMTDKAL